MPLASGTRIGRYEILELLGSGGMGDVYRARDPRLGRDVAIKVLKPGVSNDPDRLHRFEQEARATGMLNHPNVLAIHDIGAYHGAPYLVSELLEGSTLRALLDHGALPARKAIEYAIQIAHGLDAAHHKGIIHRDLKPENVFITQDGRVEVLDFGLAKLKEQLEYGEVEHTGLTTRGMETQPGMLLGSLGYIAPEQVRGSGVDPRADIFALGAVMYEMVSGRRAFDGISAADVVSAILKEDPPELSAIHPATPAAVDRIVRRCLEKRPEDRFHSAHDVALALEAISIGSSASSGVPAPAPRTRLRHLRTAALVAAAAGAIATGGYLAGDRHEPAVVVHESPANPTLSARRLTFRRGWISAARFATERHTALYSAAWEGQPPEIFMVRLDSAESRAFGLADADLLAVSRLGELAIRQHTRLGLNIYHRLGTLSRVSFGGGAPREVLEGVRSADWSPDGRELAAVRDVGDHRRLEYPLGHVLYETPNPGHNTIVSPKVSPDGERVAFFEGVGARVTRWSVNVVDRGGKKSTLSQDWHEWWSLAWSPDGREVWFAASPAGSAGTLYAVDLAGTQRMVASLPGTLEIHDVAPDGRVLAGLMTYRTFARGFVDGAGEERDLSWLDGSTAVSVSRDGSTLLLDEHGEGGGALNTAYLRHTDGSPPVQLGAGRALALSADARWALATVASTPPRLLLLPTGPGESRPLPINGFEFIRAAAWFPDGERIVLAAAEAGQGLRVFVQSIEGRPTPLTPEGWDIHGEAVSPDGRRVLAIGPVGEVAIWPVDGGEPRSIEGLGVNDIPAGWTADGRGVYVFRRGELPARVTRLDLTSGRTHLVKTLMPPDPVGVGSLSSVLVTPDGRTIIYSFEQTLSELYLIEGLK
jgi:eukaryotic-like serine/threonine-protein kinase